LTERQRKFAQLYVDGEQPLKAVVDAGYSENKADATLSKLLNSCEVSDYIQELIKKRNGRKILSKNQCREVLSEIAIDCDSSVSEKIKAVGMLIGIIDEESNDTNLSVNISYGDENGN